MKAREHKERKGSRAERHDRKMKIKRAIMLLLIASLLAGCGGQIGGDESSTQTNTAADTAETEENMPKITTWITNGFDKITAGTDAPEVVDGSASLYMAGNESEACQIVLRSDEKLEGLSFEIADAAGEDGKPAEGLSAQLLREYTLETRTGEYYPDPTAPAKENFTLQAGGTLVFLLRYTTAANTAAGSYTAAVKLKSAAGVLAEYKINIHVWDFALPEASYCATAVGLYKSSIAKIHRVSDQSEIDSLYKAYYDTLLDYKVCAYDLPYDILDERADAYMSDPRVTSFRVPCSDDDSVITAYYEKLSTNAEWMAKCMFYPLDEPTSAAMLDSLKEKAERLNRLFPGCRICTPFFLNIDYDSNTDQIAFMTGVTNLWCPKSYMYITSNIYSSAQLAKYPTFGERMAERKAAGDEVWWYVCWEPGDPYCNMFVDQLGIQHRLLFWQQKYYGADGFLYWGANYWEGTDDPWSDMATVKNLSPNVFGDGSLLYNGDKAGVYGACGSMRLEAVRDGIEDFDMFTLAEQTLGSDWVKEKIAEITPSLTKYIKNSDKFSEARKAVGDALEAALKG